MNAFLKKKTFSQDKLYFFGQVLIHTWNGDIDFKNNM